MNSIILFFLATSICIVLAGHPRYYGFEYGQAHVNEDYGKEHYGHGKDNSYSKNIVHGYDKKGYGEYGSKKHVGYEYYDKGVDKELYYGDDYDKEEEHDHHVKGDEYYKSGLDYKYKKPFQGHNDHHDHYGHEYGYQP